LPKLPYESEEVFKTKLFKAISENAKTLLTRGLDEYEREQEQQPSGTS